MMVNVCNQKGISSSCTSLLVSYETLLSSNLYGHNCIDLPQTGITGIKLHFKRLCLTKGQIQHPVQFCTKTCERKKRMNVNSVLGFGDANILE